jgi:hypothetical protein
MIAPIRQRTMAGYVMAVENVGLTRRFLGN